MREDRGTIGPPHGLCTMVEETLFGEHTRASDGTLGQQKIVRREKGWLECQPLPIFHKVEDEN